MERTEEERAPPGAACRAQGTRRRQFHPSHDLGVFWRIPGNKCSGFWHVRVSGLEKTLGFLCLSFGTAGSSGMLRDSLSPGPQFGSTKQPHLVQIARNFLCNQGKLQPSLRTLCALSRSALPAHGCLLEWAGMLERLGSRGSHSTDGDLPLELLWLWNPSPAPKKVEIHLSEQKCKRAEFSGSRCTETLTFRWLI